MSRPILVTGARAPVAIDLARSFLAAGHRARLADSVTPFAARWSSAAGAGVMRLPAARHAFPVFADALLAWARAHPDGMLVPTCEEVFYVAHAAAELGFSHQVLAPSPAVLQRLHSKIEFAHWACELGIPAPPTHAIASREEALAVDCASSQDLVFKPEYSRFGTATMVRPTARALARIEADAAHRWAAQPFIAGEEICLWTCAHQGRIVASVAYRPRWRLGRSASFAFEAVECPAGLEVARALAADAGITGQLSFDLILRPDGAAVPIECNPRAVSGLHLFGASAALARALLGEGPPVHATVGMAHLGPAMLLLGAPQALVRGQGARWRSDRSGSRDALSDAGRRVPWGALLDAARFAWCGLSRFRSPTRQSTDDIEWNGEPIR